MTSDNPFENGAVDLKGRAAVQGTDTVDAADLPDDPENEETPEIHGSVHPDVADQLSPPLDVETEPEEAPKINGRVSKSSRVKSGSAQIQHPPDESAVDDESTGETPSENADGDAVDAEIVEDTDEPLDVETSTEIQEWKPPPFPSCEPDWEHDVIEYAGFNLNVRIPTSQALTGFTMATGQYIPDNIKQAMVSKFVNLHFSPQSYAFLMMRLMDPNATDFNEETFGDIVRMLVERAGERIIAAAEAKAAAEKKKQKKGKR